MKVILEAWDHVWLHSLFHPRAWLLVVDAQ